MTLTAGPALKEQIDRLVVPQGQLALWSLGQAGFVLKGGATIVYIDPYLSDSVADGGGPARRSTTPTWSSPPTSTWITPTDRPSAR